MHEIGNVFSALVSKSGEIYSKHSHKSIRLLARASPRQKEVRETFPERLIIMQAALILFKLVSSHFTHTRWIIWSQQRAPRRHAIRTLFPSD
jgi:hypothetical protein